MGRYAEARERLEEAHSTLPEDVGVALALAKMLAAAPDPAVRDGAQALRLARALHGDRPTDRTAEALALALAETGACGEAAALLRELARQVRAAGGADRAAALEADAGRLGAGPPCRPPLAGGPASEASGSAAPPPG